MTTRTEFHPLTVTDVRRETPDAVSVAFAVPADRADLFAFSAGQYLTLRTLIDGEDVRRNYSLCVAPEAGALRVAVKHVPGGRFSTFANERLRAGDVIECLAPQGHFTHDFKATPGGHYLAFAAGSGITPVRSLIEHALTVDPAARFTLFFGNRRSSQILFLEELSALKNRHMGRFEAFHFLTMEEEDMPLFNGRMDRAKCDAILAALASPAEVTRAFVCGPEGMMLDAEAALRAAGVAEERILLERFASAGSSVVLDEAAQAKALAAAGRRIGVVLDGRKLTVKFDPAAGNILDSVRGAGVPAPFACKGGVCATCRARVVTGRVDMRLNYGLTPEEVADGYVLTCQATPASDDVVVSYDA